MTSLSIPMETIISNAGSKGITRAEIAKRIGCKEHQVLAMEAQVRKQLPNLFELDGRLFVNRPSRGDRILRVRAAIEAALAKVGYFASPAKKKSDYEQLIDSHGNTLLVDFFTGRFVLRTNDGQVRTHQDADGCDPTFDLVVNALFDPKDGAS